jgi:dienelactone hydrolase
MPIPALETLSVRIPAGDALLEGELVVPDGATGIVVFAHGSGSSRHSPRNRRVADLLHDGGLGTLLFDLLTPEEEGLDRSDGRYRFDIDLLARRLVSATDWLRVQHRTRSLSLGYFGASTGAAAAIRAAVARPRVVDAIVSRGGRPDLAGQALHHLRTPTLLIVGGADAPVLKLNEAAAAQIRAPVRLDIVPGASHLFEEPGALEAVARLALEWLSQQMRADRRSERRA